MDGKAEIGGETALLIKGMKKTRVSPSFRFELTVPELALPSGRFTAIVGESGCGKSTLLDVIALISEPDSAEQFAIDDGAVDLSAIWRRGRERRLAHLRRNIGYVLQTGGLMPFLTIRENAALSFQIMGRRSDPKRIESLAGRLGVLAQLDQIPAKLSGGQRQRAAILRALTHHPAIVLADEPTAAVDKHRAKQIISDLKDLVRNDGVTLAMVTHDVHLVAEHADQVYGFDVDPVSESESRSTCRRLSPAEVEALASGRR